MNGIFTCFCCSKMPELFHIFYLRRGKLYYILVCQMGYSHFNFSTVYYTIKTRPQQYRKHCNARSRNWEFKTKNKKYP
jgi:hypothetical protein